MTVRLQNGNTIGNRWIEQAKRLFYRVYVDHDRIRVYPTSWEYEEADIFRDEDSLKAYCLEEVEYIRSIGGYVSEEGEMTW